MDGTLRDAVKLTRELNQEPTSQADKFSPPREPYLGKRVKTVEYKNRILVKRLVSE